MGALDGSDLVECGIVCTSKDLGESLVIEDPSVVCTDPTNSSTPSMGVHNIFPRPGMGMWVPTMEIDIAELQHV